MLKKKTHTQGTRLCFEDGSDAAAASKDISLQAAEDKYSSLSGNWIKRFQSVPLVLFLFLTGVFCCLDLDKSFFSWSPLGVNCIGLQLCCDPVKVNLYNTADRGGG